MTNENTAAKYETTWLNFSLEEDVLVISEKRSAAAIPYGKGLKKSPLIIPLSELKSITFSYGGDGMYDGPFFRCRLRLGIFKSFVISNIVKLPHGGYLRRDEMYGRFLLALKERADKFGVKTVALKNLQYLLGNMSGWLSAALIYVLVEALEWKTEAILELLFDANFTGFAAQVFMVGTPVVLAGGIWLGGRQFIDKLLPALGKKEIPDTFLPLPKSELLIAEKPENEQLPGRK